MGADELLRRYLEQRRELGESELVLDQLSVDEVMKLLGARSASRAAPADAASSDWRAELEARGAKPLADRPASRAAPKVVKESGEVLAEESPTTAKAAADRGESPASSPTESPGPLAPPEQPALASLGIPTGLVVGDTAGELFAGELGESDTLEQIAAMVAGCTRCPLYKTATNPVPGEGNPHAGLMCIGEAPGATEDETGRPFVGAAGQLLTKILGAIKLSREDVFIANVLKHRPPGNRNPLPDEVKACSPYLVRQVELVRPKVIVALGTWAAQTVLNTTLSLGKLRGQIHRYRGIPLIVTYHPAALLRNPAWKRPTWEDVQLARRILDQSGA